MDPLTLVFAVLAAAGLLLLVMGLTALITGRGPLPDAITRHLPREPASPRDRRWQGLGMTITCIGLLVQLWTANREMTAPPRDLTILAGLLLGFALILTGPLVNLAARQRIRRTSEVLSGWDEISRAFRS